MQNTTKAIILERMVGRATDAEIAASHRTVAADRKLMTLIDALSDFILVLNDRRQIVAVNRTTLTALDVERPEDLIGQRPGEAFGCIHAQDGVDGCGTGLHCTTCGAALSIVSAQKEDRTQVMECRLTLGTKHSALDLEVVTTPLHMDGERYYVCALKDIGAAKRRDVLERVFFHDVINTAGGIHGLASLLLESDLSREEDLEYRQWMRNLSGKLIEEIKQQRQLLAAEQNEFVPDLAPFPLSRVLEDVQSLYANHEVASGKILRIEGRRDIQIISDEAIVRRILGNLVKNALEATRAGETVYLGCHDMGDEIRFCVRNPAVMPEEVRLQIFQRSFSTKSGAGRGVGTYSVKLFGEKYLKGKVHFTSQAPDGTIFTFTLSKGPLADRAHS